MLPALLTIARSPGSSLGDTRKYWALAVAATSPVLVPTPEPVDEGVGIAGRLTFARTGVEEEEGEEEEEVGRGFVRLVQQLRTIRSNTRRSLRSSMPWLISSTTRKGAEVRDWRAIKYLKVENKEVVV